MYLYYCENCHRLEQHVDENGHYNCSICWKPFCPLKVTTDEWINLSGEKKKTILRRAKPSKPSHARIRITSDSSPDEEKIEISKIINKQLSRRNSSDKISEGCFFYFYVSAPDPITEVYIKDYYKDISVIKNQYKDDSSINYKFSVPSYNKDEVCLVLYLLINKKLSLPKIYGVPIRDLYLFSINRYYKDDNLNELRSISLKLGLNSIIEVDQFIKKLEKIYPTKVLVDENAVLTYAMRLSPEYDKRYYYHTVNNEGYYGSMYLQRLTDLMERGLVNAKWKSEFSVFILVKEDFPDTIYQYRDSWLGLLSLDVYIPSIKTAIEYQGIQHYEEIGIWGGEQALEKRKQLDLEKKQKCIEHGVTLIEWKYDIPVTRENYNQYFKPLLAKHKLI